MPSNKQVLAMVAETYATKASPTFTGTVTLPSGTALTSPVLSGPVMSSPSGSGFDITETVEFQEDATSTTHTGTVTIPAGATLKDIVVTTTVLWGGGTASLIVGDAQDPDGWFAATDLKATDLLVGEALRMADATTGWGGKNGVYLVAATGQMGQATATKAGPTYKTAGSVIGVVTVGTPASTAGRTQMAVTYSVGTARVATAA